MGRGEAGAGHQGPFNEFISQIILRAARSAHARGRGRGMRRRGRGGAQWQVLLRPHPWVCTERRRPHPAGVRNKGPQIQASAATFHLHAALALDRPEPAGSKAKWENLIRIPPRGDCTTTRKVTEWAPAPAPPQDWKSPLAPLQGCGGGPLEQSASGSQRLSLLVCETGDTARRVCTSNPCWVRPSRHPGRAGALSPTPSSHSCLPSPHPQPGMTSGFGLLLGKTFRVQTEGQAGGS